MKRKSKIILIICAVLAVLVLIPAGFAWYEYRGQYRLLINGDGTINQNAFGVLNGEEYRAPEYGYGTTPGNPFVVDSYERLLNLIKLNNGGRLEKSKKRDGSSQYYFVLNFTGEETPQVLDLSGAVIASVGNNQYPFVDHISGLLYAYTYTVEGVKYFVYLSGCIRPVEVTVEGGKVYFDGVETSIQEGTAAKGRYIKIPEMYMDYEGADGITTENGIYVREENLLKINNVIANAVVEVPDEQVDVGFFSTLGVKKITSGDKTVEVRGTVRDFILHNITINCVETTPKSVWQAIVHLWNDIIGHDETTENDPPAGDEYKGRHIGIFAGHVDGDIENITVSGSSDLKILSKDVNYYSGFTTVGYFDPDAKIGTIKFSALSEIGTGVNSDTGCMFADSIFAAAEPGADSYIIKDILAGEDWDGVSTVEVTGGLYFSYGAFRFILSDSNDTVGKIWNGDGNVIKMLNKDGYIAAKSVLYCNDEYRYSNVTKPGGSLDSNAASTNETKYKGAHALVASGSMIDRGKYVIAAKVGDSYYALKIVARIENNTVIYTFDTSEKRDITISKRHTKRKVIAQSETAADSSTDCETCVLAETI